MKKIITTIILLILTTYVSSCAYIIKSTTKIQVVTTLYAEYSMTKEILDASEETKNLCDVTMIIKPGQDSHTYDPSIEDLIKIKNADIFIYTADDMETWVNSIEFSSKTKVINLSKNENIELIAVEDGEEEEHDHTHEHSHAHTHDPHYWLYPVYATYMVTEIKNALKEKIKDPLGTKQIALENSTQNYIDELLSIHEDLKVVTKNAKQRTMYFGSPFTFYYWAHFYNLDYELIYSTCSIETEPSLSELEHMIHHMKENNIKYIFAKELVNQEACEMISFHTGAQIIVLHSGHNLSSLEFGNPQFSYLNILRTNVINLAKMLEVDEEIINTLGKE